MELEGRGKEEAKQEDVKCQEVMPGTKEGNKRLVIKHILSGSQGKKLEGSRNNVQEEAKEDQEALSGRKDEKQRLVLITNLPENLTGNREEEETVQEVSSGTKEGKKRLVSFTNFPENLPGKREGEETDQEVSSGTKERKKRLESLTNLPRILPGNKEEEEAVQEDTTGLKEGSQRLVIRDYMSGKMNICQENVPEETRKEESELAETKEKEEEAAVREDRVEDEAVQEPQGTKKGRNRLEFKNYKLIKIRDPFLTNTEGVGGSPLLTPKMPENKATPEKAQGGGSPKKSKTIKVGPPRSKESKHHIGVKKENSVQLVQYLHFFKTNPYGQKQANPTPKQSHHPNHSNKPPPRLQKIPTNQQNIWVQGQKHHEASNKKNCNQKPPKTLSSFLTR